MEGQQKHVIHLYQFEQQSINEKQLTKLILESLKTYLGQKIPLIKIKGRSNKYWAYFEIDPNTAAELSKLKEIQIGTYKVHIGRYYHDYQIFIKVLSPTVSRDQIIAYFSQFGEVVGTVITEPANNKIEDFKHCYIKMKDQKTIDRVVLARMHKIKDKEIKLVRTFGLEEDKQSDKKLFLKIQGAPDSQEEFQQNAIQYFMKFGKIRQRPKFQTTKTNLKFKMVITYTSPKDAANALQSFQNSSLLSDYQKKNVKLILSYFHTKQNKIYVIGLKQVAVPVIRQAFEQFGEVTDISINRSKVNSQLSAIISYANQNDFKMALAFGTEKPKIKAIFYKKPYITIYMTNEQKKSYQQNKKKQQNQNSYQQPRYNNYPTVNAFYPQQVTMPINPPFRQLDIPILTQTIPQNILPHNMMSPNLHMPGQYNQGVGFNRVFPKQTPTTTRNI